MSNPGYLKGRRFEAKTRALLEDEGYACIRAAGSKGVWDLIAWNSEKYRHIQVKVNQKPGREEMGVIASERLPDNGFKEIWIWHDRVKMPTILYVQ